MLKSYPDGLPANAPDMWDALSFGAKAQIILLIGVLEFWGEAGRSSHYMRGGEPGRYPDFTGMGNGAGSEIPHPFPVKGLYKPFGSKPMAAEKSARGLLCEINNGRLAMIGIMGFLAEAKVRAPYTAPCITTYDRHNEPYRVLRGHRAVHCAESCIPRMLHVGVMLA